jgi:hypothetical protein
MHKKKAAGRRGVPYAYALRESRQNQTGLTEIRWAIGLLPDSRFETSTVLESDRKLPGIPKKPPGNFT